MSIKSENDLKEEYLSWLDSIKLRRMAYESATKYLREAEYNLKKAKRIRYLTYRDWVIARKEAKTSKNRWKSQPYRLRKWAKEHMDKVFELFDKGVEK